MAIKKHNFVDYKRTKSGNKYKVEIIIRDEDFKEVGRFKKTAREFPNVCQTIKEKFGIDFKPSISFEQSAMKEEMEFLKGSLFK
jgi:hypothetical protein